MAPERRAETRSWETWLKIHFNNCLIESSVGLYILYYIYLYYDWNAKAMSHLKTYVRTSQMKHQLDATLCRFFFSAGSLYMFRAQAPISRTIHTTIHINHNNILIQVSMLMLISYVFLQNTCTSGRCTSFKYSWWWALAPETCRVTLQK